MKITKLISRISKWSQELLFTKTMRTIKKSKKQFFFILLFDIVMILAFIIINIIADFIFPNSGMDFVAGLSSIFSMIFFVLIYILIYFFIIIAAYSFVKYCILNLISSMSKKQKFSLTRLKEFTWLNMRIISIPFIAFMILVFIISLVIEKKYASMLVILILLPVMFFYYPFMNLCQSLFYKGKKQPVRKAIAMTFPGIRKYISIYVSSIIAIAAYLILSMAVAVILKYMLFRTEALYYAYYPGFTAGYNVITIIGLYLLMSFNRVSFYKIVDT
ncbi:MAG: hypothetical protein U9R34_07380 [Nanoarchaeota archaeon]|nr:hypothetical protein [Nanoarchaeota archaeon]